MHHIILLISHLCTNFYSNQVWLIQIWLIPKQDYARENMLVTVVPNRNTMMLSLAWTIACAQNAEVLAFGPHKGDNYVYADCRPDYFLAMNLSLRLGTIDSRHEDLNLSAPF